MRYLNLSIHFLSAFLFTYFTAYSQEYSIDEDGSQIKIEGTSTLHNWHAKFFEFEGNATMEFGDKVITDISQMVVNISVNSFESGKNGMEKNAREALKEAEFPELLFTLTRLEKVDDHEILGLGLLTIGGVSREVTLNVNYKIFETDIVEFSGSFDLNMTDFEIEPPSALLGTVKTGDAITVKFKVIYRKM